MKTVKEVFVVTSSGSGHLFPCIELCKHFSSRNYKVTLVLPSNLSSSLASSFHHHPLHATAEVAPFTRPNMAQAQVSQDIEAHLSSRKSEPISGPPICAIIDFQVGWTKHIFWRHSIPVVSFFTFGACAAAMEWGAWKSNAKVHHPGEVHTIPGLPEELHITNSDFTRHPESATRGGGPPTPGEQPPWVPLIEGSTALLFNTCDDLERPFLNYLTDQLTMQVFGVGPLLPENFFEPSDSLSSDAKIRSRKHQSDHSEEEVIQWLDTKAKNSVLYISFASEVGLTIEDEAQLAGALEEWAGPFVWVIKSGPGTQNLKTQYPNQQEKGLRIRGWAPQLLILSHPSIGGFLSHCGWNSTVEAICRAVPILAWPIRGDQIYNAKLVVDHLKVGYMALGSDTTSKTIKDGLLTGIGKIMSDEDVISRVALYSCKILSGFPNGPSAAAFDALVNFVDRGEPVVGKPS